LTRPDRWADAPVSGSKESWEFLRPEVNDAGHHARFCALLQKVAQHAYVVSEMRRIVRHRAPIHITFAECRERGNDLPERSACKLVHFFIGNNVAQIDDITVIDRSLLIWPHHKERVEKPNVSQSLSGRTCKEGVFNDASKTT